MLGLIWSKMTPFTTSEINISQGTDNNLIKGCWTFQYMRYQLHFEPVTIKSIHLNLLESSICASTEISSLIFVEFFVGDSGSPCTDQWCTDSCPLEVKHTETQYLTWFGKTTYIHGRVPYY